MSDRPKLSTALRKIIERAARDLREGDHESALTALDDLLGTRHSTVRVVPIQRESLPERVPATLRSDVVMSQPKPQGRIEDRVIIDAYREAHPVCEVAGPDCWYAMHYPEGHPRAGQPMVEVHHVVKKSEAGCADISANFLSLCTAHHTGNLGWHTLTPVKWFARFVDRLSTLALAKVNYYLREKRWNPEFVDTVAAA